MMGRKRIVRYLKNQLEKKPYDDYLLIPKPYVKAIIEMLKNERINGN